MMPPEDNQKKHRYHMIVPVFLVVFGLVGAGYRIGLNPQEPIPTKQDSAPVVSQEDEQEKPILDEFVSDPVILIPRTPLPQEVRGIYWTATTAGGKRGQELVDYMLETGLNTAVIDVKMDDGELAFEPVNPDLKPYVMDKPAISDLDGLLTELQEKGIYRIARIAVMRDGAFAFVHPEVAMKTAGGNLWQDNIGSYWVDPAATEVADYAIALAREAYARGFDEVQFDYVRFASDGRISAIVYPLYKTSELKVDAMKRFFAAVGDPLRQEKIPVSFDLFGLVCMANDGLGIGQRLEDVT